MQRILHDLIEHVAFVSSCLLFVSFMMFLKTVRFQFGLIFNLAWLQTGTKLLPWICCFCSPKLLPWICCFCFLNNGWRSSMPDMKSEPYPETYRVDISRGHITCFWHGLAPCPAHQTLFLWYPRPSPLMACRLPLLSQPTCGPKWSSFISSSCPGWSSSR